MIWRHMRCRNCEGLLDGPVQDPHTTGFRLPSDTLAARQFVAHLEEDNRYLASPSIITLDSGRLLVLYEKCGTFHAPRLSRFFVLLRRVWNTKLMRRLSSSDRHRMLPRACRQASWNHEDPKTQYKIIMASDDRGKTWTQLATPGPIHWSQLFRCKSGAVLL